MTVDLAILLAIAIPCSGFVVWALCTLPPREYDD